MLILLLVFGLFGLALHALIKVKLRYLRIGLRARLAELIIDIGAVKHAQSPHTRRPHSHLTFYQPLGINPGSSVVAYAVRTDDPGWSVAAEPPPGRTTMDRWPGQGPARPATPPYAAAAIWHPACSWPDHRNPYPAAERPFCLSGARPVPGEPPSRRLVRPCCTRADRRNPRLGWNRARLPGPAKGDAEQRGRLTYREWSGDVPSGPVARSAPSSCHPRRKAGTGAHLVPGSTRRRSGPRHEERGNA